jgi:hypothetical protein
MGSNALAEPSFVTGPNDNLLAVDVFSGTAAGIVNSIASLAAQYDVDLIGMLRAGSAAAQALPVVQGVTNGSLLLNPQAAIARLLTASNTLTAAVGSTPVTSAFNSLSSSLQSVLAAPASVMGQVEVTVGSAVSQILNGAISDVAGLGSLINAFSNSSDFLITDTQALTGMAAGIINAAASYGISGAFGAMVSEITNPTVLNGIIQQTLPNLVAASDLTSLQAVASSTTAAGISSINPAFLSSFTTSYSRSATGANTTQATPAMDGQTWNSIFTCFNTASPGWNTVQRAGDVTISSGPDPTSTAVSSINITALQGGTDDFNSALAAGVFASAQTTPGAAATDLITPFYGLAPLYPAVDPNVQMKAMYPNTYIDPALRASQPTVEPTQLMAGSNTVVNAATSSTVVQNPTLTTGSTRSSGAQSGGSTVLSGGSSLPTPAANDTVGNQPNPATYTSVGGNAYMSVPNPAGGNPETYLVNTGASANGVTSAGVNWGVSVSWCGCGCDV